MTINEVKARLKEIKKVTHDPEVAHSMQDDLFTDVLTAIAEGQPDAQLLAKEALKVKKIEFERWMA